MVAVDDSSSMRHNRAGAAAIEAFVTLCRALTRLEAGELSVVSFGKEVRLVHPFGRPFTDDAGAAAVSQFTFQQEGTEVASLLETALFMLNRAAETGRARHTVGSGVSCRQLLFVISDGIMSEEGRDKVRRWVRVAAERGQMLCLVVVDNAKASAQGTKEGKDKGRGKGASILESVRVQFGANASEGWSPSNKKGKKSGGRKRARGRGKKMTVTRYLDDYPWPNYVICQDVSQLPDALCDILRQFFELMRE